MTNLHAVEITIAASWIVTAGATAMPTPGLNASTFYKWLFGFGHIIAGAIPRLVATFFPQYAKFFGAADLASSQIPQQEQPPK